MQQVQNPNTNLSTPYPLYVQSQWGLFVLSIRDWTSGRYNPADPATEEIIHWILLLLFAIAVSLHWVYLQQYCTCLKNNICLICIVL